MGPRTSIWFSPAIRPLWWPAALAAQLIAAGLHRADFRRHGDDPRAPPGSSPASSRRRVLTSETRRQSDRAFASAAGVRRRSAARSGCVHDRRRHCEYLVPGPRRRHLRPHHAGRRRHDRPKRECDSLPPRPHLRRRLRHHPHRRAAGDGVRHGNLVFTRRHSYRPSSANPKETFNAHRSTGRHQHDGAGGARPLCTDRSPRRPCCSTACRPTFSVLSAARPGAPWASPCVVGSMAQYSSSFGPVVSRLYDMGTQVATSVQQGAQNFRCVRVTDGSDLAAASLTVQSADHLHARFTPAATATASASRSPPDRRQAARAITVALPGQYARSLRQHHRHRMPPCGRRWWPPSTPAMGRCSGASRTVTAQLCRRHDGARRRHLQLLRRHAGHGWRDQRHVRHAGRQRLRATHRNVCVARAGLLCRPSRRLHRHDGIYDAGGLRAVRRGLYGPDRTVRRYH